MNDVNSTKGLEADVIPGIFRLESPREITPEPDETPTTEDVSPAEGLSTEKLGTAALSNSGTIEA